MIPWDDTESGLCWCCDALAWWRCDAPACDRWVCWTHTQLVCQYWDVHAMDGVDVYCPAHVPHEPHEAAS